MGASWSSRKGGILEREEGVDHENRGEVCPPYQPCYSVRSEGLQTVDKWSGFKVISLQVLRNVNPDRKYQLTAKMLFKIHFMTYYSQK